MPKRGGWKYYVVERDRFYRITNNWDTVEIWSDREKRYVRYSGDTARLAMDAIEIEDPRLELQG